MNHIGLILDSWERDVLAKRFATVTYDDMKHISPVLGDEVLLLRDAREYMSTLPVRTARICDMYYTVGHTHEKIAEIESMTPAAVRKTLSRAGKKLRERYGT